MMVSVVKRIEQIQKNTQTKQPYGGYIRPTKLTKTQMASEQELAPAENIHAPLVGLAVDYLTRYQLGTPLEEAFDISLMGALLMKKPDTAFDLISNISGLDDHSITSACQLVGFDAVHRAGKVSYKPVETIQPDLDTINNIRTMVNRSLNFFKEYGPIIKDGFTFEGGYTELVNTGDGDFLTKDTLWDFKVSKKTPTSAHTLQILMYWMMGVASGQDEFNGIENLGIFNPRLNTVFQIPIAEVSPEAIAAVSKEVIGYDDRQTTVLLQAREHMGKGQQ